MSRHGCAIGVSLFAEALAIPGVANADSTEDYPIPPRILHTSCTAEQLLAAARDDEPIYYERYMIDMHNKPPNVQQSAKDGIHYFLSLPNWSNVFFNNKGVAASETDYCANYPRDDQAVWVW